MSELFPSLTGRFGDGESAVCVAGETVSWAELVRRAGAVASRLTGMPAVAIKATPTLDTVVGVVAGLLAGVPVVPMPADAGPMEREHMLRDSGAAATIGDPQWAEVTLPQVPVVGEAEWSGAEPADDATALIMYTSGTTGLPKGVVLSRRSIAADLDGLAEAWQWSPADTLVHGLPLFHVHGLVLGVLGALRVGSRVVHTGKPTPQAYAEASGTMYFGVPTVWSRICAEPALASSLRSARLVVSGSAPLPVAVFDEMTRLIGQPPIERYGMTETLITVSTRADGERRPGWVGMPIVGVESRLVDEGGAALEHDGSTIGELQIRGATMFDRYLNRPEATAASFDGDWFRTGDAAVIDDGGFHRIVGRQSVDIIKTGGFKVGAGEVEAALLTHPGVVEAAVIGVSDTDLGQRIVAFVVGDSLDSAQLIEHVAVLLSVHKRPREVRVVAVLPRNAMGKVQKTLLM
ncbi:MAG: fatty acid CoA ligase FadD36 [Ilumatobacteraceae bacterium]|nr:fatty acid CoA ligase FadD36 [Ilumatobacteraceae bacterium]